MSFFLVRTCISYPGDPRFARCALSAVRNLVLSIVNIILFCACLAVNALRIALSFLLLRVLQCSRIFLCCCHEKRFKGRVNAEKTMPQLLLIVESASYLRARISGINEFRSFWYTCVFIFISPCGTTLFPSSAYQVCDEPGTRNP